MGQNGAGRVVAITGASAGIGRATALRLARDGAAIVACARRADRLEQLGQEIEAAGGRVVTVVADVTREGDMNGLVVRAVEQFGRLDVMICNAGFAIYGAIDDMTFEISLTSGEIEEGFAAFTEKREPSWVPEAFRTGERL